MVGAMLLLIGIGLASNLVFSWIGRLVNHTQSVPAMAVFLALSSFALIYVYSRLMLLVPRAGLGRGIGLSKSWRLTRAALLPLALVFLLPQALAIPLSSALHVVLPGYLEGTPFGPADAVLMLIYLAISPFGWGAQIAMLPVLEPVAKAAA